MWQPIETAPKDGRELLLWDENGSCCVAFFEQRRDGTSHWVLGQVENTSLVLSSVATHWMPLPETPQ